MDQVSLMDIVRSAVRAVLDMDGDLLFRDNSERCITARLAHHMQNNVDLRFPGSAWMVDVEFNRQGYGNDPKLLANLQGCSQKFTAAGQAQVVPDLIIHDRLVPGQNIFVAEIKKTTNNESRNCDRRRIFAFRESFRYEYGALIDFETRRGRRSLASLLWFVDGAWIEEAELVEPVRRA